MPNIFSECGLGRPGGKPGIPDRARPEALGRIFELAKFDALLTALATCGRSLTEAATQLEAAPPKLLQELGVVFPDGELLPALASTFEACRARLQQSIRQTKTAQELVGAAQKRGADIRQVIAARDAAWAPKQEADKNAEVLSKRFGKSLPMKDRRAKLQAKHEADEQFRRCDEKARSALSTFLDQRWQVTAEILAEICCSHATLFAGSQHLSGDFSRLAQQLLCPGAMPERESLGSAGGQSPRASGGEAVDPSTPAVASDAKPSSTDAPALALPPPVSLTSCPPTTSAGAPEEVTKACSSKSSPALLMPSTPAELAPAPAPAREPSHETAEQHRRTSSEEFGSFMQDFELVQQQPDSALQAPSSVPTFSGVVTNVPEGSAPVVRRRSSGSSGSCEPPTGQTPNAEVSTSESRMQHEPQDASEPEDSAPPAFSFGGLLGSIFGAAANQTEASPTPHRLPTAELDEVSASASASTAPLGETKTLRTVASLAAAQAAPRPKNDLSDRRVDSEDELNTATGLHAGDRVQVLSKKQGGWVDARVDKVFKEPGVADGYHVPAGVIQVSFSHGMKFIRPEQVASHLRRMAAAGGA